MRTFILQILLCSGILLGQWVLPEVIEHSGSFLVEEEKSIMQTSTDRLLDDPEFFHSMEILDDLGGRCFEQSKSGTNYNIQFYAEPNDSHLHQADLFNLARDLQFQNLEAFHDRITDLLISLDRISIKHPELTEYTIDDWILLLNRFHEMNPGMLWRSSSGPCDDLCMAEAYAEFVTSAAALAAGVLGTAAIPPLSALIAFGGSVFTVLRFINRLRKCCK